MKYLFTTVQGLEDVVIEELAERFRGVRAEAAYMSGRVIAEVPAKAGELLAPRSIERFGVFVASGRFSALSDVVEGVRGKMEDILAYASGATSIGVSTERVGSHHFKSRDVEAAVGQLFKDAGFVISLVDPDIELNVDVVYDTYYVWITARRESLRNRPYRAYRHHASLNPIVAYAMARLARLKDGETVCDLTCGGGTICIEAALHRGVRCICVDAGLKHLAGSAKNAEAAGVGGSVDLLLFDSTKLGRLLRPICDAFIFNPPFGVRMPGDIAKLYKGLNRAMRALARGGARAVVVTPRWRSFLRYFGGEVLERRVIYQGGIYSSIIVGMLQGRG